MTGTLGCHTPDISYTSQGVTSNDLPIVAVRRKHDAGTGVRVARHPCAVDGKEHHHHEESDDDDALDVHPDSFFLRLVFFALLHLSAGLDRRVKAKKSINQYIKLV